MRYRKMVYCADIVKRQHVQLFGDDGDKNMLSICVMMVILSITNRQIYDTPCDDDGEHVKVCDDCGGYIVKLCDDCDGYIVKLCDDGDGYIVNLCDDGGDGYIVNCQQVETPLKGFT